MSTSTTLRLSALGLAAAAIVAAGALASHSLRVSAAEPPASLQQPGAPANRDERGVRVEAPDTQVNVDQQGGRVSVIAPHTNVQVDPDQGRVRVRAPYVNLDVNW